MKRLQESMAEPEQEKLEIQDQGSSGEDLLQV